MHSLINFFKQLIDALRRGHRFVTRDVWEIGKPGEEIPRGLIIKNIRVAILLVRGIYEETLLLRASALTFATMLFIVPFLVFMFAFIQTFSLGDDVYSWISIKSKERIEWVMEHFPGIDEATLSEVTGKPLDDGEVVIDEEKSETSARSFDQDPLMQRFAQKADTGTGAASVGRDGGSNSNERGPPVAAAADETVAKRSNRELWNAFIGWMFPGWESHIAEEGTEDYIDPVELMVGLVEQEMNVQTLGITGVIWILITVLGLMRNVEWSFNRIWGVNHSRNLFRTLSDYLMITLLLPFVAAGVLGITTALEAFESLGTLSVPVRAAQLAVVCLTFSLLYYVVPNTKVEVRYALLAGVVAGSLWMLMSWLYVSAQVGMVRNTFFYSKLALFPLLLFWIYSSWIVLLFGALVAFAYQNEETFAMERFSDDASFAYREAVAVRAVVEMTRRFRQGLPGLSPQSMAKEWNVPLRLLNDTLESLTDAKIITACATEPVSYQPARAPENLKVREVVSAVREAGQDPSLLRKDEAYGQLYEDLHASDPNTLMVSVSELADRIDEHAAATDNVVSDVSFTAGERKV